MYVVDLADGFSSDEFTGTLPSTGITFVMSASPEELSTWRRFNVLAVAQGAACLDSKTVQMSGQVRPGEWIVRVRHPNGFETLYAHLSNLEVVTRCTSPASDWQAVLPGDKLGMTGSDVNRTSRPYLWFSLRAPDGFEHRALKLDMDVVERSVAVGRLTCGQEHYMIVCPPRGMRRYLREISTDVAAGTVVIHPRLPRMYLFSPRSASIEVVDLTANASIGMIELTAIPTAMDIDRESGQLFVASMESSTITIFDDAALTVTRVVPVPTPKRVVIDSVNEWVFVLSDFHLTKLDARSGAVQQTIAIGQFCTDLDVRPNVDEVVITTNDGKLLVVSAPTMEISRQISVAPGRSLSALWIDQRTNDAFVAVPSDDTLRVVRGESVARIVSLPSTPTALSGNSRAGRVYVVGTKPNGVTSVLIFDAASGTIISNIDDRNRIASVAVDPRTSRLLLGYVNRRGVRVFRD